MKIIGLFPMRDEQWILPVTMTALRPFVDSIIALDGSSTNASRLAVEAEGGTVIAQGDTTVDYSSWRQRLLDAGRQAGGTHFVWLDADEGFNSNFLPTFRHHLQRMKPGQKMILDWISLWKSPYHMVSHGSILAKIPKDFVFCDDGTSQFHEGIMHEGRTPGGHEESRYYRIDRSEGVVLHFQAVAFRRFQIKQAFMRAREWASTKARAWDINARYSLTLDNSAITCESVPAAWLEAYRGLESLLDVDPGWFYSGTLEYFQRRGVRFFEPIELWHIPEFREVFEKEVGRSPCPILKPPLHVHLKRSLVRGVRQQLARLKH